MNTAGGRAPGADLFIAKPFEVEQVLASVQSLLSEPPCVPEDTAG
jgi:DNA-binding response OmpR family regulator